MAEESSTKGKTAWDFLAHLIAAPVLLGIALVLALVVGLVTHASAEPGSEVQLLWGLAKYTKAKAKTTEPSSPTEAPDTSNYVYLKEAFTQGLSYSFHTAQPRIYAILDQAVNVYCDDKAVVFGGARVEDLAVAGRTEKGHALAVRRDVRTQSLVVEMKSDIAEIELSYKGKFLAARAYRTGEERGKLWVTPLASPTLRLQQYKDL